MLTARCDEQRTEVLNSGEQIGRESRRETFLLVGCRDALRNCVSIGHASFGNVRRERPQSLVWLTEADHRSHFHFSSRFEAHSRCSTLFCTRLYGSALFEAVRGSTRRDQGALGPLPRHRPRAQLAPNARLALMQLSDYRLLTGFNLSLFACATELPASFLVAHARRRSFVSIEARVHLFSSHSLSLASTIPRYLRRSLGE